MSRDNRELDDKHIKRFWEKVRKSDGCWIWIAGKHPDGRGVFAINRKITLAPRVSWFLAKGEIPDGMFVCHKCDNPSCVNPDHLFLGTQKDNMSDAARKKRLRQHRQDYVPIRGEAHYRSKLTEAEVRQAKLMRNAGMSARDIAELYGVHPTTVQKAASGKNWKHLKALGEEV